MALCFYVQITPNLAATTTHLWCQFLWVPNPEVARPGGPGSDSSEAAAGVSAGLPSPLKAPSASKEAPPLAVGRRPQLLPCGLSPGLPECPHNVAPPGVSDQRGRRKLSAGHDLAQSHSHSCPGQPSSAGMGLYVGTDTGGGHSGAGPPSWRLVAKGRAEPKCCLTLTPALTGTSCISAPGADSVPLSPFFV